MSKVMRAIGLMSGTSLDGIDVALIETDGEDRVTRGPALTYPYSPAFREQLRHALAEARTIRRRDERPGRLALVERYLTDLHAEAVDNFLADTQLDQGGIDVIGFHGQTVLHRPEEGLTVQLGLGAELAVATGIDVVWDMRADDCAAGGQGAPLVPVYHRALVAGLPQRPIALVNIGGVANITYVGPAGELIAFDCGPGNAMIDDWMARHGRGTMDTDGAAAAAGTASEGIVRFYLGHSHFQIAPPKSLDRNAFPVDLVEGLGVEDGAATLTAFTASAIAKAREVLPREPQLWIVAGGGRRNRTLMSLLAAKVQNAVVPAEAVGLGGDSLEAEAWAYLAVRSLKSLPITYPTTTGVPTPLTGGRHARGRS